MKIIKKATGGGITPPALSNPATADQAVTGFDFINDQNLKVVGTVPINTLDVTLDASQTSQVIPEGVFIGGLNKVQIVTQTAQITPGAAVQHAEPDAGKVLTDVEVAAIPSPYFDVSGVTAAAADVPVGKKIVTAAGALTEGTMAVRGSNNVEVTTVAGTTIPAGSYDGTGKAILSAAEAAKAIPENIKDGVTFLGVTGTLEGGATVWDVSSAQDNSVLAYLAPDSDATHYVLNIVGSGTMKNFSPTTAPWYSYRGNITELYLNPGIQNIGNSAFFNFVLLTSVDASNIITIGNGAFSGCSALSSIDASSATTINNDAFFNCTSLTTIDLSSAANIDNAFLGCTNVSFTSLTIGSAGHAVASISAFAFVNDAQITSITVYTTDGAALANQPWGAANATVTYLTA